MAKFNLLNQAESFMSERNISQLHDNANKKTRKRRYFIQGVMKRKIQEKNLKRLRFAERVEIENEQFENKIL